MKKYIFIILSLLSIYLVYNTAKAKEYVIIPNESIRIRIIPHSDLPEDIYIKELVKESMEKELFTLLNNSKDIDTSRERILTNIEHFENNINKIFLDNDYNKTFMINYGNNYFPKKEYQGVIYNEGEYESLVVSIGDAKGSNWWCVLFPPLCMLEAKENSKVEYKFLVKDILDKIF